MRPEYDLIIIGGGINGCAVARQAALSGLSVTLFEKNDFGSGATSRSTRLIHGGLRYLESGRVGLVRESLRDRRSLLHHFPDQVRPQPFLIPVYDSDTRPPWYIALGLQLYRLLAWERELSRTRRLTAAEAAETEPGLNRRGLRAAFLYHDCLAVYPERLALDMALEAQAAGAVVRNHTRVTGFVVSASRVVGVRLDERGREAEVRGRLVVNAAGPWIDQVRAMLPVRAKEPLLALLNGAHVVVRPFPGAPRHAVYHEARSDQRPFFVVPWRGLYVIGTTETPFHGDPDDAAPTLEEVGYLLREANYLLPEAHLNRESILFVWVGSRPLLRVASANPHSASREHAIYDHQREEGLAGIITLVGGKLTTAPSFARQVLDLVGRKLRVTLPAFRAWNGVSNGEGDLSSVDPRLAGIYGARARELQRFSDERPERKNRVVPQAETTVAEIIYTVREEKACTLGDILLRRTGLGFHPEWEPGWAQTVARIAAPWLRWSDADVVQALRDYEAEARKILVPAP